MKIVFLSNYLNHHQLPLCLAFSKLGDVDFTFIATTRTPQFRLRLGYHNMNEEYGFVLRTYESRMNVALAQTLCTEADVVITGVASDKFIEERLKTHKLTFRYSERVYKDGCKLYARQIRSMCTASPEANKSASTADSNFFLSNPMYYLTEIRYPRHSLSGSPYNFLDCPQIESYDSYTTPEVQ